MNIAIIGGGITGLTTALALHKMGMQATVYERAPELNEVGAGVWLQPNAVQVLEWLGIKDKIHRAGTELLKMEITNPRLTPFKKLKKEVVEDAFQNRTITIHRGRLQKVLAEEFQKVGKVEFDHTYQSHTLNGSDIQLNFEKGTATCNILLGADGIHSAMRPHLFPNTEIRKSNQICWRGIARYELPKHLMNKGKEAWGKGVRFGFSNISDDEVYWFAVAKNVAENQGLSPLQISKLFQQFDPIVPSIIQETEHVHTAVLSDLKRLPRWSSGSVCLMGDAAHATTPNMGQGACQGMEDAYYMANFLSKHHQNVPEAFAAFERQRRSKVDYVVNNSWRFGQAAHSSMGRFFLKMVLKATPEKVMSAQMNKLYAIQDYGS